MKVLFRSYLFISWLGTALGVYLWPDLGADGRRRFVGLIIGVVLLYTLIWAWREFYSKKTGGADLLDLSEDVSFKAQQLIWLIEENNTEAQNLVELFDDVAAAMQDNAASVEEVSAGIEEVSTASQEINQKTEELARVCEKTLSSSRENKDWIEEAGNTLLEISTTINNSKESMNNLQKVADNVDKLLHEIQGITGQINLLALNASIEAARAGESGQGFSVVAEEIKELSEETDELTQEIQTTLEEFQSELDNNAKIITEGSSRIENVEQVSTKSAQSFEQIINNLEKIKNFMEDLRENTDSQAHSMEETSKAVESITQETVEVSDRVEEMNERVETQHQNSEQILDYSHKLNQVGYNLHCRSMGQKDDCVLVFGVNPFAEPDKVKELYVPVIEEVAGRLNKKAKTIIVSNYETLTDYIKEGLVDVGWFSPLAYVEAKSQSDIQPLVTPLINGEPSYRGYIFTRKESKYEKIEDIKGSTFGFVDPLSASGYVYPKNLLQEVGIDIEKDLKDKYFLGAHNRVIEGVINGKVEVGATYNEAWERAEKDGKPLGELKILKKTAPIPKDVIAARPGFSGRVASNLQAKFIKLTDDPEAAEKMSPADIDGFIETKDENYDIIRRYRG